ncbi:hypothetical protein SAMN05660745_02590 [Corynebacterium glucuronolyticum]|nr:hypothetical protein CGLUCO_10020 [Corynebacterium glucuronolyticum DSM 44120]SMB82231.1 hypothetical protein SAMN05660745_02590 [Corynebacterium glucuronolyticum]
MYYCLYTLDVTTLFMPNVELTPFVWTPDSRLVGSGER